jgi:ribose transport system ATP-binding protein
VTLGSPARLAIHNLDKTFGPAKVLAGVDLTVDPGEILGLAGQNGSGKSTLIKIITGIYTPDAGAELAVDGRSMHLPVRWPEVHAAGVSVVHQDLGLLDELNVADNICVGGYPTQGFTHRIDRKRQRDVALRALRRIGAQIDPARLAGTLSAPERAEVAVARALRDHTPGHGLVIMDESTRSLVGADLSRVHGILRVLASEGTSVILISHSLPELLAVTDRVTILRDGRVTGARLKTSELTEQEIARRMLGSDALGSDLQPAPFRVPASETRAPAIVVSGLTGQRVSNVSFSAGRGEIVGITGLPGSGYEDIPYLLTGAMTPANGRLKVGAENLELSRTSIARTLKAGVVLVPEQRIKDGLAGELTVRDNITLPNLLQRGRPWFLSQKWQSRDADEAVRTFGIRPHDTGRLVKTLSGGNQQKVLLAKWLGAGPKVLVLHEPTQAVDVGARQDILLAIRRAAEGGVTVVVVSGEPSDLGAICDRIYIAENEGGLIEVGSRTPDELLERIYSQEPIHKKVGMSHVE